MPASPPTTPPDTTPQSAPQSAPKAGNRLWVVWLLYFFQFLAGGAYIIYLNIYYRQAGLSGTQIGMITMTSSIVGAVSIVIWGNLSDRTGNPRLLIATGAVGAVVIAQLVPLVHTYQAFFALSILAHMFTAALGTLIDGATLAMLGSKSQNYGRYRLGGSLGYMLATGISGLIYNRTGLAPIFPVYGFLMCIFAATAFLLPAIPVKVERRSFAQLGLMVRQPVWIIFAASIFLIWVANFAGMTFMGIVLVSLGGSQGLVGLAATTSALVELPFMAFSGPLINRFGLSRLMLLAMALFMVRNILVSQMPDPNWILYINLINGPAFGLIATCAVDYAKKLAPPSQMVTAVGLLNSTISLAGVVSAYLSGVLFDWVGPRGLMLSMAGCCLMALVLFGGSLLRARSRQTQLI